MNTRIAVRAPPTPPTRPLWPQWACTFALLAAGACSNDGPPVVDDTVTERENLRQKLAPTVRDELRDELRPVVLEELRRELGPDATSPPSTQPPSPHPPATRPPHVTTPEPPRQPNPDPNDDLWNRPGTTIWPSPGGLRLVELSVGTGLEDKLPIGIESHYQSVPEILYCYTVFENPWPDQTITHVWRRSGRLVSKVELEVGKSPKWRTWSKQRTAPHWRGVWSCEVLSSDGTQLGLHVFQIGG